MYSSVHIPFCFALFFVTYGVTAITTTPLEANAGTGEENPLVEYVLHKYVIPRLETTLQNTQNDTTKLVNDVNNILGSTILSKNGDNIQIDYKNLLNLIKLQGRTTLAKIIGTNDIILSLLAQYRLSTTLDNYFAPFEGPIKRASFPVILGPEMPTRKLRAAAPASLETVLIRSVFSNLIGQVLAPVQVFVNQTLVNVGNSLVSLKQLPSAATDLFGSLRVSIINEAITQVVNLIEVIRNQINTLLLSSGTTPSATKAIYKRAVSTEISTKSTRSASDIILSPLRFIAGIILSPLHSILKSVINYAFTNLRPVVGGIILGPLQSLLLAIVNLIPCTNC